MKRDVDGDGDRDRGTTRQSRGEASLPLASTAAKTHMISPMNTGDARFTASEIASSRNATTRLNRHSFHSAGLTVRFFDAFRASVKLL